MTTISIIRRDDDQLVERARIAYAKSGGREQPSSASDVADINGATIITLRNVNGPLARYSLLGSALTRIPVLNAEQMHDAAFGRPRDPRSAEYKVGVRAALDFRIDGVRIRRPLPRRVRPGRRFRRRPSRGSRHLARGHGICSGGSMSAGPEVTPNLVRTVTAASMLSRHLISGDDKLVCATSILIAVSQFVSGTFECNDIGMAGVQNAYDSIIQAAAAGGFKDADILHEYIQRNRWTSVSYELLEEVVACAGGADAVLDALDLANFDIGSAVMQ